MFIIGLELSLRDILLVGRRVMLAAVLQILLTIGLGFLIGTIFHSGTGASVGLGFALALSSTAVVLKSLEDHGQVQTQFGQVMLAFLVIQDLAVVIMLALLPVLGRYAETNALVLMEALVRSGLFVLASVMIASKLVPRLLDFIAKLGSHELFALTVITLSFGAAYATYKLGFSVALGAFIAGVIVGESEYTHQVFADVSPLRNVFAAVFFFSIGVNFRPEFVMRNIPEQVAVLLAVVFGKFLVVFCLLLMVREHHKVAFLSGVGLAQMGEFSFVIAQVGNASGSITGSVYDIIMSTTLLSLLLTPLLIQLSPVLYSRLSDTRWFVNVDKRSAPMIEREMTRLLKDHVIVLGYGIVGQLVGAGLHAQGVQYAVVDYNSEAIRRARSRGIPAIYGDAANPEVIKAADPKQARAVVVALPGTIDSWRAVKHLHDAYPNLPVIARAPTEVDIGRLYAEGADEVVNPRQEAGMEMLRHIFTHLGIPQAKREEFIERMRHWEPP